MEKLTAVNIIFVLFVTVTVLVISEFVSITAVNQESVSTTACMRKFIIMLNAMVRDLYAVSCIAFFDLGWSQKD